MHRESIYEDLISNKEKPELQARIFKYEYQKTVQIS